MAEQATVNRLAEGSTPSRAANFRSISVCPYRLAVRTLPFHGSSPGSIPGGDAIFRVVAEFAQARMIWSGYDLREIEISKGVTESLDWGVTT